MNKGLEVIEAMWLFNISAKNIEVVVHRQSIIHSAVRFIDGSIVAQLTPDMKLPIHYALSFSKTAVKLKKFDLDTRTFHLKGPTTKHLKTCLWLFLRPKKVEAFLAF